MSVSTEQTEVFGGPVEGRIFCGGLTGWKVYGGDDVGLLVYFAHVFAVCLCVVGDVSWRRILADEFVPEREK